MPELHATFVLTLVPQAPELSHHSMLYFRSSSPPCLVMAEVNMPRGATCRTGSIVSYHEPFHRLQTMNAFQLNPPPPPPSATHTHTRTHLTAPLDSRAEQPDLLPHRFQRLTPARVPCGRPGTHQRRQREQHATGGGGGGRSRRCSRPASRTTTTTPASTPGRRELLDTSAATMALEHATPAARRGTHRRSRPLCR